MAKGTKISMPKLHPYSHVHLNIIFSCQDMVPMDKENVVCMYNGNRIIISVLKWGEEEE
jgi:hypothetical protein